MNWRIAIVFFYILGIVLTAIGIVGLSGEPPKYNCYYLTYVGALIQGFNLMFESSVHVMYAKDVEKDGETKLVHVRRGPGEKSWCSDRFFDITAISFGLSFLGQVGVLLQAVL